MPIRIYTHSPARQLMEDRPFGIVAWADASPLGEVYAITYTAEGMPIFRGRRFSLSQGELDGSIEHAMRMHLAELWGDLPDPQDVPFEALLEEIPVEEFALTQIDKPSIRGVVAQISLEAQSEELANAFATFHQPG